MEKEDNSINFKEKNKFIFKILNKCINNKIPFYIYRKSEIENIVCGIQISSPNCIIEESELIKKSGFIISPFDTKKILNSKNNYSFKNAPLLLIRDEKSFNSDNIDSFDSHFLDKIDFSKNQLFYIKDNSPKEFIKVAYEKEEYKKTIQETIGKINSGNLDKVVISKSVLIPKKEKNDIEIFDSLLNSYPNEFVFWAYVPNMTSWMGASPEMLLSKDKNTYKTMALAGTQKIIKSKEYSEKLSDTWDKKEIIEQDIVSKYIRNTLSKTTKNPIEESLPSSKKAGNLIHICTNFTFQDILSRESIYNLIRTLHPTPALCGFPKDKAKEYIIVTEKHDRLYYSGFLGPVYKDSSFDFFVNLRSMEIFNDYFLLFVGGGITSDSIPEDEWNETEAKLQTLLKFIS